MAATAVALVAAGMMLLHTRSHPGRRGTDLEARDEGLLLDLFGKRQEMQRAHDRRQGRRHGAVEVRHKHYPRTGEDSWHAWDGDQEVGTLWVVPSGFPSGTIADVDVHPDHRRRGIATQLWEAAGRPAHSVNYLSDDGRGWASAVGGDMDTYE